MNAFRRTTVSIPVSLTVALVGGLLAAAPAPTALAQPYEAEILESRSISDAIEDEFLFDQAVPYDRIDVETREGVVTLSGRVSSLLVKRRAERVAETVKGVRTVINDVEVDPLLDRSGGEIAQSVDAALLRNSATEGYQVNVRATDDGAVTLRGSVDSRAERNLAETVAAGVTGVTAIDNELSVEYDTNRPDRALEAEIAERLKWSTLVDSGLVDVAVNEGRAVLTGTVGSAAERRMAETLAWVTGVTSVDASGLQARRWARDPDLRATPEIVSDETIAEAVESALLYDPRVAEEKVTVEVENAGVTLRGVVDSITGRRAAEQLARNTSGVLTVENRLKVRLGERVADRALHGRIEAAFVDDPLIDPGTVNAAVNDGTVRLYGSVDDYYDKGRVENVVAQVEGVTGIVNNLTVENPTRPDSFDPYIDPWPTQVYPWYDYEPGVSYADDSQLREDINDQLWWSPYVDADEVTVTVEDGIATLTGTVDSMAERRAAAENAFEGGATWVVNKLEVAADAS